MKKQYNKKSLMHAHMPLKTGSRLERVRLSLWPENQNEFPANMAGKNASSKGSAAEGGVSSEDLLSKKEQRCCDKATD